MMSDQETEKKGEILIPFCPFSHPFVFLVLCTAKAAQYLFHEDYKLKVCFSFLKNFSANSWNLLICVCDLFCFLVFKFASVETSPILSKICLSFSVNFDWVNSTRIKLLFVDESNKTT